MPKRLDKESQSAKGPSTSNDGMRSRARRDDLLAELQAGWIDDCIEGLFRIDLDRPVSLDLDPDRQLEHVLQHGRLTEANKAMMRLLAGEDIVAGGWIGSSRILHGAVKALVEARFEIRDVEICARSQRGALLLSGTAGFQNGRVLRIWGRCRPTAKGLEPLEALNGFERERQRIGLELHDGIGQLLTALRITSQDIADTIFDEDDPIRLRCLNLAMEADEALSLLRQITTELSPAALLKHDTLKAALEALVEYACQTGQVHCELQWHDDIRFRRPETRAHIYRIVQEAVNNAVKHAAARLIVVSGEAGPEGVAISVSDDGLGFDVHKDGTTIGIQGLRYRAKLLAAELSIESTAGRGTVVTCRLPAHHQLRANGTI